VITVMAERLAAVPAHGNHGSGVYKVFGSSQVISALAESSTVARSSSEPPLHIPYRDSKLTKLLMDSLVCSLL
jgi:hypothetical protein